MIVRNTMRKFMGVAVIAVIGVSGAFVASPMLAAGAATGPQCTITSATTVTVAAAGGTVVVTGTAPVGVGTVIVTVYINGVATVSQNVADGAAFSLSVTAAPGNVITVNFTSLDGSSYIGVCATIAGVASIQVEAAAVTKVSAALALTGSSETTSYVLIGIAALVLGIVLVVAARRRSQVNA